jgi:hypothetical protein
MAAMAINADGGIKIAGRDCTGMVAVQLLLKLLRMTGSTLPAAFYLESAMIHSSEFGMWKPLDTAMAGCAMQRFMNRGI